MMLPKPKDAVHKAWLYRTLAGIYDDANLAAVLAFKGGTCAAMLGYLDRFSVDLDFDYLGTAGELSGTRGRMKKIFDDLGLVVKDQSKSGLQYFLKYDTPEPGRNTIKIDAAFPPPRANTYELKRFQEIDRIIRCQTLPTMAANKLVALMDRYEKNESIAGRDVYDIHHFFSRGYGYNEGVIRERTGEKPFLFFTSLIEFIEKRITDEILTQDLNVLIPHENFRRIRKTLKNETLLFLRDEVKRLGR